MDRESVPFLAYEAEFTCIERRIRRLWVAVVVAVAALGISNIIWLLMMVH